MVAEHDLDIHFCFDGGIDRLGDVDSIALGIFEDERPLKGTAGLVDWRLHGRLSRLLLSSFVTGQFMESCLTPAGDHLPMDKVILFGQGSLEALDARRFTQVAEEILSTLGRIGSTHFAWSIWDLTRGRLAPEEAAGILYRQFLAENEGRQDHPLKSVTCIEHGPWGRAIQDAFRQLSARHTELPLRLRVR